MDDTLRDIRVEKRPATVRITGRILYLTEDPGLLRRQLEGEDLDWDPSIPLRDEISTDEITPAYICYYADETLGEFPYLGLACRGEFPVGRGSVKAGGFEVCVSGKRRGKGSSREQSPYAELCAGIGIVVAESIERIYNQNCQNLGVLTTTDFSVLDRIRRGEEIPLEAFTAGLDPITRQIVERGGLFPFNVARMQGGVELPVPDTPPRPMTLAEKIFARHFIIDAGTGETGAAAVKPGDAGFLRTDLRFSHEYVTPMAAGFFRERMGEEGKVTDPGSVIFFRDHLTFLDQAMTEERKAQGLLEVANQLKVTQEAFALEQGITLHGELEGGRKGSEGICHSIMLERYAEPGMLIIGSDSHTSHSGAVGCVAFGVGTTDVFNSWVTRDVRVRVPEQVQVRVEGERPANVTAKDFMLAILAHPYVKEGHAIGKVVEYCGPAVEDLTIDERATMTNMAAEVGAFTGLVAPDEKTVRFLVEQRGMGEETARKLCEGLRSDPEAEWAEVVRIEAGALGPMVATPGDPGNGVRIDDLPEPVRIDIAYGGSCTAGKREDMDMYARVLKEAVEQGRRVHPDVTFWIQYGSQDVRKYCEGRGYLEVFEAAGVRTIEPSCGACINAGPGVSSNADQVTVSAINRNFPGRSGPGRMYLASPLTVAASALEGCIAAWTPGGPAGR